MNSSRPDLSGLPHAKAKPRASGIDHIVGLLDDALRTVFGVPPKQRPTPRPQDRTQEDITDAGARQRAARLMRVNHAGEVCAQALYQAQAVTARSEKVRHALEQAAQEENDHLRWCEERLEQLDGHKSRLNAVWYCGSFAIGSAFGLVGDRWSLGFLAETERQVVRHLEGHLARLPSGDVVSRAILEQMRIDEGEHATRAVKTGAIELPLPIKRLMAFTARIMTTTAERI